jgi:hypothetical protein
MDEIKQIFDNKPDEFIDYISNDSKSDEIVHSMDMRRLAYLYESLIELFEGQLNEH